MISTKFDRRALAEVYEVLMLLEKSQLLKIPQNLIKSIKENKDNDYEVDMDEIENGKMLPDTNNILACIYTYYLATDEEKNIINKLVNIEKEKNKKDYKIFKEKKLKKGETVDLTIAQNQNFVSKIIRKIKSIWSVLNGERR